MAGSDGASRSVFRPRRRLLAEGGYDDRHDDRAAAGGHPSAYDRFHIASTQAPYSANPGYGASAHKRAPGQGVRNRLGGGFGARGAGPGVLGAIRWQSDREREIKMRDEERRLKDNKEREDRVQREKEEDEARTRQCKADAEALAKAKREEKERQEKYEKMLLEMKPEERETHLKNKQERDAKRKQRLQIFFDQSEKHVKDHEERVSNFKAGLDKKGKKLADYEEELEEITMSAKKVDDMLMKIDTNSKASVTNAAWCYEKKWEFEKRYSDHRARLEVLKRGRWLQKKEQLELDAERERRGINRKSDGWHLFTLGRDDDGPGDGGEDEHDDGLDRFDNPGACVDDYDGLGESDGGPFDSYVDYDGKDEYEDEDPKIPEPKLKDHELQQVPELRENVRILLEEKVPEIRNDVTTLTNKLQHELETSFQRTSKHCSEQFAELHLAIQQQQFTQQDHHHQVQMLQHQLQAQLQQQQQFLIDQQVFFQNQFRQVQQLHHEQMQEQKEMHQKQSEEIKAAANAAIEAVRKEKTANSFVGNETGTLGLSGKHEPLQLRAL